MAKVKKKAAEVATVEQKPPHPVIQTLRLYFNSRFEYGGLSYMADLLELIEPPYGSMARKHAEAIAKTMTYMLAYANENERGDHQKTMEELLDVLEYLLQNNL